MNIIIVAGEASGDLLGGKLVSSLKKLRQDLAITGIGGNAMRAAGMQTLFDVNQTSVVGIVEVLKHYPRLRHILSKLKHHIKKTNPAVLILIDYPEFNLKLAKFAKQLRVKVFFYVSPQVWAWRTGRIKKIRENVDLMAVLFPFELEFYQQENVPACLVRHPILTDVDRYYAAKKPHKQTISVGLLPGSRKNEIQRLLPVMFAAAESLYEKNKTLEFIIPIAPGRKKEELQKHQPDHLPVSYSSENIYTTIANCDVLAVASGTATLQVALMGKAMVILYKISSLTYRLFGHMINVKHVGLANIILDKRIFTELIQQDATTEALEYELEKLLNDTQLEENMKIMRATLYNKLDVGINSDELAQKIIKLTV